MTGTLLLLATLSAVGPIAHATDRVPDPFVLVDAEGNPLSGMQVSVQGRTGSTITLADGSFRLVPEPATPFRLVALDEGGRLAGAVEVEAVPADRRLVLLPVSVETVRVLGGIAPSTRVPPAAAATTLSREERTRTAPVRLVEILEEIPGTENSGSGQTAVPSIRGLAGGRTLILLDDARVRAERRAGPSATYLDPFGLENVEVVRGPGSLSYGSDAIGGVIHARTPVPRSGSNAGRYEIAAGTGVRLASAAGEWNLPVGRGAVLVQFHQRRFEDYDSPDGREPNSSARDRGVLVKGSLPLGDGKMVVGLQVDRGRDIERPALDSDRRRTVYPREDSERLTLALDLPGRLGFNRAELRAFAGSYRLVTERESLGETGTAELLRRSDVDANDATLRLVGDRALGRGSLRAGVDLSGRFSLRATDFEAAFGEDGEPAVILDEVSIASARRLDAGLFAEGEMPLGRNRRTLLSAGLRADRISTRNSGGFFGSRSGSDGAVSGYAAVRHRPAGTPLEFTLQAARGFRAPRLSDLFFRGTTGRGTVTGNPDLEPETSRQLDLSVRTEIDGVEITAYGYLYRIRDLIERYQAADGEFAFRNRSEQEIHGVELEATYPLSDRFVIQGAATWARGEILDDGTAPSDIPSRSLHLVLNHRPSDRWWWRIGWRLSARDDRPGPTERTVPGHSVVDGSLGFRLRDDLELRLRLENLADESYPASSDENAPPAPGRSAGFVVAGFF